MGGLWHDAGRKEGHHVVEVLELVQIKWMMFTVETAGNQASK
jgi:hypothetical protein